MPSHEPKAVLKGTFTVVPHLYLDISLSRYIQAEIKAPMEVISDLNDKTVPAHGLGGSTRKCHQFFLKECSRLRMVKLWIVLASYSKMYTSSSRNRSLSYDTELNLEGVGS